MNVPGYSTEAAIHEDRHGTVYRGRRRDDDAPVLIKTANGDRSHAGADRRLEWEYEITRSLSADGILPAFDLVTLEAGSALILQDAGALPLAAVLEEDPPQLRALAIAIELAASLGSIHQQGVMHRAIHPSHVFVHPRSGQVRLTGFGAASRLPDEKARQVVASAPLSGDGLSLQTLAYLSPEQTGRMNRRVGYQADFYSFGVLLYELLTGQLPFAAGDPLELIHAHIARAPTPPAAIRPGVPSPLSDVVMKLLAKAAEDRYQSAQGLATDLQACLEGKAGQGFAPGRLDVSDQLRIPEKLYGRRREHESLMAAFDRVTDGATELLLVSGYSGIGKSALVHEVHKPIVRQRGYFIAGKFDQFQRNIPYSAVIGAFQELTRQLLTESESQIAAWRSRLRDALESNGRVITDVIPEIELIIGPQPPAPALPPAETRNRFNLAFERFIKVFAQADHPLVVFLDDLQWADAATLALLPALLTDPTLRYLLVIGAYRDNEVATGHPLAQTLAEIEEEGQSNVQQIRLAPLAPEDLLQLIADTLRCPDDSATSLAQLVHEKTDGNPFFVIQFIKVLHSEGVLAFDDRQRQWTFDLAGIRDMGITDNVVDLMVRKIERLPETTQNAVKLASCIGNRFDLATLGIVCQMPPRQAAAELHDAVHLGLILPESEAGCRFAEFRESPMVTSAHRVDLAPESATYRFLHDRVQQAAYALIPEDDKQIVHLRVGMLRWEHSDRAGLDEHLFEIVGHLNAGASLITEEATRARVAELNLRAGRKAKSATAYEPALTYFEQGIAQLPAGGSKTPYDLAFALHLERAEAAYLCGHLERAERLLERLLERAASPLEKAEIYRMRIVQYENASRFSEALDSARTGLALFDVVFPTDQQELEVGLEDEVAAIHALIGDREIEDLIHLPVMTDEAMRISMQLLMTMWAPSVILGDMTLTAMISARMVRLSLTFGNVEASAYGYVTHGAFVSLSNGDYASGYAFGQLGLEVNERFDDRYARAKVHHIFSERISLWRQPLAVGFAHSREAFRAGLNSGDFNYATYAVFHESWHALFSGQPLKEYHDHYSSHLAFLTKTKNQTFFDTHQLILHVGVALLGHTENPCSLTSDDFDEKSYLPRYGSIDLFASFYYVAKLQLLYLGGKFDQADLVARQANEVAYATGGMIWDAWRCFYEALTLAARYPSLSANVRPTAVLRLDALAAQMQVWAQNCPENFSAHHALLVAETAAIRGEVDKAMTAFERAAREAATHGFIQVEALANECYARFWLRRGNESVAELYLRAAVRCYQLWGASTKVDDLRTRYSRHLPAPSRDATDSHALDALDLTTVIRAAQVISGEVEQRRLLDRLLHIVLENAGAQRGCLLLEREGELWIEAEGTASDEGGSVVPDAPAQATHVESSRSLALSVVHYVARVGDGIVLADATRDDRFSGDPYIRKHQPRSLLCTPILHQGKPIGMLYLENNLVRDAFTPDRIEVVGILASQAAISLENARLYEEMKQEIADRRQAEAALRKVAEATAPVTGSDYFDSLARHLAAAFDVRYALVSRCTDATNTRVRTVSFWNGEDFGDNFAYDLAGTPCETVISGDACHHPDQIQILFPGDESLADIEARGYLGIPLYNVSGKIVGHMAILDDKPMPRGPHDLEVLNMFAARAGAELERKHAEDALRQAHDDLELRVRGRTEELSGTNRRLQQEIAERAQIEQRLQEAKEAAETANHAKSEFLASMSHELRTPLNAILGYAQILRRDQQLGDRQQNGVGVIERSGEHLLTLINDILSLSKIEAGKLEAAPTDFHLPAFLEDVADIARVRAEQKGLSFSYQPDASLPAAVRGDERLLRQVLLNLLGNAAKFTDRGGVTLRVQERARGATAAGLRFEVEDTGIGISADKLAEMFEPFQQVHPADRREEGTGLGLAISRNLIQLMGGSIDVRSTPGEGSVFGVDVALSADARLEATAIRRRIIGFEGETRRILVVDDKAENRAVLVGLLSPLGFELAEAEDGRAAQRMAEAWHPHVVLMDLVMPAMDGFEAARRIRRSPELADVVILALSASVFEHDQQQSMDAGCHDFIAKPVQAELLLEKLEQHAGLEWIYAEDPVRRPPFGGTRPRTDPDVAPPASGRQVTVFAPEASTLETLHHLAMAGDVQALEQELEATLNRDARSAPFVAEIRRMAGDYDMERISDFITPYLEATHEHETE